MFEAHSDEIDRLAGASAVAACWAQWVALGSPASPTSEGRAASIVDPEALVLLSLSVVERERRLLDLVSWWARVGSRLTSVQRFRSVAELFSSDAARRGLSRFAGLATASGDRRWARHAGAGDAGPATREKGADTPSLEEPCSLWLRLRAGVGVGAKADTLAFLLGAPDRRASTRSIASATGYSSVAVRAAAGEMAMARFIHETSVRPAEYSAPAEAWAGLLGFPGPERVPPWRFWAQVFAFLDGAIAWAAAAGSAGAPGPHVLASRARGLLDAHGRTFELDRIPLPRPRSYRGLATVDALLETTRVVSRWIEDNL